MIQRSLKYIDHYYVGTYITPKAKSYMETRKREIVKQKNKFKEDVEVTHNIMSFEDYLQSPIFDIVNKMDPNTSDGFYHNIYNTIEFDKDLKYKYLKATNNKALPPELQF